MLTESLKWGTSRRHPRSKGSDSRGLGGAQEGAGSQPGDTSPWEMVRLGWVVEV